MLVRIRSKDGNFRFELNPEDDISILVAQILSTAENIDPATLALSNQPRGGENLVSAITGDLAALGLNHGDLLFASYNLLDAPTPIATSSTLSGLAVPVESTLIIPSNAPSTAPTGAKKLWELAQEEAVDTYWESKDGKIARKKGTDVCQCGPKAMCDFCMPLEPFDPAYQEEKKIKHLSFHSHLRKINASAPLSSQSTSYIPPLSDPSYSVQVPCTSASHPSWPAGICTKCQPSPVTLSRQTFRMVDHVEFAQATLVEGLLAFWRKTGTQRFGYMLGRYEPYDKVPMGIKAVVEAIHEPPQEPLADGVTVGFPWEESSRVERVAAACGLKVVGIIYTDLLADTSTKEATAEGKVIYKRHANSFFLSSLEVIFSATLQRAFPNPSRFSATGAFSSKFVTCVLSGDADGGIAIEAYQTSDQAMAMVDADMIEASVDPGVMRVKEELPTRYIPDVFYRYKNKYGIEVKESAKPCFPVEYLLVNVSHGFPTEPNPLFKTLTPFNIENRAGVQDQSMALVSSRFSELLKTVPAELVGYNDGFESFDSEKGKGRASDVEKLNKVVDWLSDYHLLSFLDGVGLFEPSDIQLMAHIATTRDAAQLATLFNTAGWKTFLAVAKESAPTVPVRDYPGAMGGKFDDGFEIPPDVDVPPSAYQAAEDDDVVMDGDGNGAATGVIACPHCTFENSATASDCDVCGLPLQ